MLKYELGFTAINGILDILVSCIICNIVYQCDGALPQDSDSDSESVVDSDAEISDDVSSGVEEYEDDYLARKNSLERKMDSLNSMHLLQ